MILLLAFAGGAVFGFGAVVAGVLLGRHLMRPHVLHPVPEIAGVSQGPGEVIPVDRPGEWTSDTVPASDFFSGVLPQTDEDAPVADDANLIGMGMN